MTFTLGINGFGRIGRLTLRAALETGLDQHFTLKRINDPAGDAETLAHLYNYDSVHGIATQTAVASPQHLQFGSQQAHLTQQTSIADVDWSDCDVVLEASGQFRKTEALRPYLAKGVKKVVVTAPVKDADALNIVMGVNQSSYQADKHDIITAASCTTNCIAPVVKVIQSNFGIAHGSFTTIHDLTNTQTILDSAHKDLRRARACGMSLIPTSTGSATAIIEIFPELKDKLNGHAVRVPLANASLTDCVFELQCEASAEEVNHALKQASEHELAGILAYEELPLVSIDYRSNPHSVIVDALSTLVVNKRQLKLYLWYDNEWGYANRCLELIQMVASR